MKNLRTACALCVCLFLTGCWDKVELENHAFVSAIAIDAYNQNSIIENAISFNTPDEASQFVATVSMPGREGNNSDDVILTAVADAFMPALSLIKLGTPQEPYYGQAKVIVLGEGMLGDANIMRQAFDGMERNREISRKIVMLACEGDAAEILRADIAGEQFGMYIANFYTDKRSALGMAFKKDLEGVLKDMRRAAGIIIPKVAVREASGDSKGSGASGIVELSGAAIIRDFELVGWLDDAEVRGLLFAQSMGKNARITTDFGGVRVPLRLASQRAKLNFDKTADGLVCKLEITAKGSVEGYRANSAGDISSAENIARLNELFANEIAEEVTSAFTRFAETGVDGFGIFDRLRKFNYGLYEEFVLGEEIELADIVFIPVVDVRITDVGAIR